MFSCPWESVHCLPTATLQDPVSLCFPVKVQAPLSQVLRPVRGWASSPDCLPQVARVKGVEDTAEGWKGQISCTLTLGATSPVFPPQGPAVLCSGDGAGSSLPSAATGDGQGWFTLQGKFLICCRYGAGITATLTPSQDGQVVVSALPHSCPWAWLACATRVSLAVLSS